MTDRRVMARAMSRTIDRALRVTHGRVDWTVALEDIRDIAPTRLRTPVRDSFAAWKTAAWFDRHAPRDLYDLWALALAGALTRSAAELFATHTGFGPRKTTCSRQRRPFMTGRNSCRDKRASPSGRTRLCRSSAQPGR